MDYVVSTNGLTKIYGKHRAVDNVSLHIKRGEIYGFIGRNGAGKTTFMKMITGLATPTEGEISLFGATGKNIKFAGERIGNLIEDPGLYPKMTGFQNLKCKALALGVYKKEYIQELLELVGLPYVGNKKVGKYSLGMKQRLGIAMALVGGPDLLILDEPINGLDPEGIAEIRGIIRKLAEEKNMTIMISSHILEELSKVADTFGIINDGKLVQEISREELDEKCQNYMEIKLDDAAKGCTIIDNLGIKDYKVVGNDTILLYEGTNRAGEINTVLVKNDITVSGINVMQKTLEEYFLEVIGGKANV